MKIDKQIKDMKPGEVGYTVSWAIWRQENNKLYITGSYPVECGMRGTLDTRIEMSDSGRIFVAKSTITKNNYKPFDQMFFDLLCSIEVIVVPDWGV